MSLVVAKPFVNAVKSTMEMMVGLEAIPKRSYMKEEPTPGEVSGVIGLAGRKVLGSLALKFPQDLLVKVFQSMTGEDVPEPTQPVYDTVAELANIVAGSAKTTYSELGIHFNIAIPYVAIGKDHQISYGPDEEVVVVPCGIDGETFYLEIMMKKVG